jgi:uncharacterized protein (DUF1697 family)
MKYLALLRGINVGGNNKVAMSELRACFEAQNFTDVSTYINSGNILFSSDITDVVKLVKICEMAIERQFGFPVVVTVISATDYADALAHAPTWWASGDRKITRSDALFVIPPTSAQEVLDVLQQKSDVPDKFAAHGQVVFWSLPMAAYNKSVVPKIIGTPIYQRITVRSSTTTKKLAKLMGVA